MRLIITLARSLAVLVPLQVILACSMVSAVPSGASAQTELYRWGSGEATEFRFAAANERWVVLEREVDRIHQEVVVLRARDGVEVLRTEGASLPEGSYYSIRESWDLTMRPFLSGDRLITFRAGEVLVAVDIPSGRELWRTPLPSRHMMQNALTVTDTHVAWVDLSGGLRVFDAATGTRLWQAPMRPRDSGTYVTLGLDGSATALTWDYEVVSWTTAGVEQSRLALAPDWGAHTVLRHGNLAVVLGTRIHVVDIRTGRLVIESEPHEWTSGAFVGDDLVVGSDRGVAALTPRTLRPRWRSSHVGAVAVATRARIGIARGNGVLTWLDARTGTDVGSMSVGDPHEFHRYRPRVTWGFVPGAAAADGATPAQDVVLVRGSNAALIAFSALGQAPARETQASGVVRINGRRRSSVRVQVGDQRVTSGAGGRFMARTSLAGVIRVSVSADEVERRAVLPCSNDVVALVDPAAPRPVSLDARALDFECDAACHCD